MSSNSRPPVPPRRPGLLGGLPEEQANRIVERLTQSLDTSPNPNRLRGLLADADPSSEGLGNALSEALANRPQPQNALRGLLAGPPSDRNSIANALLEIFARDHGNRSSTLFTGKLDEERRVRRVFFSFHYQNDIKRVQIVRQSWRTKKDRDDAGYFDGSLEEKAKAEGDAAVKRLINGRMEGCSVLCVLIGSETWMRRWCRYEIFKAIERGMGVFGTRIHGISSMREGPSYAGNNPFDWLALIPSDRDRGKLLPHVWTGQRWVRFVEADPIPASAHPKIVAGHPVKLSNLFDSENDWVWDDGYSNLGEWVHNAAVAVGKK